MEAYFSNTGIFIAGLVFLIDDLGVPFPSGITLFTAAVFAAKSPNLSPIILLLVCISYAFLGNVILFLWGQHGARKWLHTHGHKFFLPEKRLLRLEQKFETKHGGKTIFLTSLITNVRPFMSLIVGSIGTPFRKFAPLSLAGISIWATSIVAAGYFLGQHALHIIWHNWPVAGAIIAGSLVGFFLKRSTSTR